MSIGIRYCTVRLMVWKRLSMSIDLVWGWIFSTVHGLVPRMYVSSRNEADIGQSLSEKRADRRSRLIGGLELIWDVGWSGTVAGVGPGLVWESGLVWEVD
jgi:hypothetical protein